MDVFDKHITARRAALAVIAAVMLVAGCGDKNPDVQPGKRPDTGTATATVYLPADIPDGAECAGCGMLVEKDGLFSAEAFGRDGKAMYFCDIGDLLIYLGKQGGTEKPSAYVRDYGTGGWVSAYDATYLADAPVRTPMRFGIAAFESRPDAEAFRDKEGGGTIYSYAGIQAEKPYE